MIKEFWNERRQEKKRLKAERKANRKNPKTKEQIAYKIFGVFFALTRCHQSSRMQQDKESATL